MSRDDKMRELFQLHRSAVSGYWQGAGEIPKSRCDLREHYGKILDQEIAPPCWAVDQMLEWARAL